MHIAVEIVGIQILLKEMKKEEFGALETELITMIMKVQVDAVDIIQGNTRKSILYFIRKLMRVF